MDFSCVLSRLSCYLSKGLVKVHSLDIYLTTFFGVLRFKNISAMRLIFFLKMFKTESRFQKCKKTEKIFFCLWDNCIWKCGNKLYLLRRQYLSSAVNVLTNGPNIFHTQTFSNWISFTVINKYGKGALIQISTVFRSVYCVSFWRVLWNRNF